MAGEFSADEGRPVFSRIKRQLDQHPRPAALAGGAVVAGLVAAARAVARRRPEHGRFRRKADGLRHAFSRMAANPDRVARSKPSWVNKLVVGVLTTVAATAARRFTERAVAAPGSSPRRPGHR